MRFIADDKIPVRYPQFFLNGIVAGQLVQPRDGKAGLLKGVARNGGFQTVAGQDFKTKVKLAKKLILPLLGKAAGADDQAALEIATGYQFLDKQARHDGLARAGVVGQHIPQGNATQHFLIDGGNLMGERLYVGRMYGQVGIEEMGVMDAPGFGNKAQPRPIGIKAPGEAGLPHCQRGLILTIEEPAARLSPAVPVGHVQHRVAVPVHGHNGDGPLCVNAEQLAPDGYILKLHHAPPRWVVAVRCT